MIDRDLGNFRARKDMIVSKQSEQTQRLAAHYVDQLSDWGQITTRPLFGAIALYRNKRVFAMTWHGGLYFKVDDDSRGDYETAGSHPLGYTAEGEEQALKSYWEVPADVIESQDKLHAWAERAYQVALKSGKR
ncbi:MAG TPA: TfoX/Sxy family protein [Caulobacter sp.]|nr:TfoX/Sxy family protein [Caulobacter sp.]